VVFGVLTLLFNIVVAPLVMIAVLFWLLGPLVDLFDWVTVIVTGPKPKPEISLRVAPGNGSPSETPGSDSPNV